jgi:hypothetical protein
MNLFTKLASDFEVVATTPSPNRGSPEPAPPPESLTCRTCHKNQFWRDFYDNVHCANCKPPLDKCLVARWLNLVELGDGPELIDDPIKHPYAPPRRPPLSECPPGAEVDEWGTWSWEWPDRPATTVCKKTKKRPRGQRSRTHKNNQKRKLFTTERGHD